MTGLFGEFYTMSMSFVSPLNIAIASASTILLVAWALKPTQRAPLPPGPPGLPIVGNIMDMPRSKEWITFAEWGKKWGRPMIIINSAEAMSQFDKHGSIYSDRPKFVMAGELVGHEGSLVLTPYGPRFRSFRKYFSRLIGTPSAVEQHCHEILGHQTRRFLKRTLANSEDLNQNLRKSVISLGPHMHIRVHPKSHFVFRFIRLTGGIILQLTYGYEVQEGTDPLVTLIEGVNDNFSLATVPGAFIVDILPSLKKFPEWLPGMGFMALAREWAKDTKDMIEVPYNYTQKQIADGIARTCFVSENLESSMSEKDMHEVKLAASSMYGGGADTTVSAELAFFLAMVLYPNVQEKAQAEIDNVIGLERLPTLADRPYLPYVNAILSEVLRWNSVAPS
ncbi:hypothetical protein H0H93_011243, partial [Arthromyces matolae]